MKKLLIIVLIATSMTGVAHAADCTVNTIGQSCTPVGGGTGTCVQTEIGVACSVSGAPEAVSPSANTQVQSKNTTSGFVALAPIPGLTKDATADTKGLANFFNNLYKFLIGIAATLAVIMIIWGGLEYSTQDSVSKKSDGKERILQAIFGLILVLSPVLVFSIINPSILNLSINLPELDTKSVPGGSNTKPSTLSDVGVQLRGGKVVETFDVISNLSPRQKAQVLDDKQVQCSQQTGGLGVVLPTLGEGNGDKYVCQLCDENYTVKLYAPGSKPLPGQPLSGPPLPGPRGECVANPTVAQTASSIEDYYATPPTGMTCLVPKDTSKGAYFCTKDAQSCNVMYKTFGAANVTTGCTPF